MSLLSFLLLGGLGYMMLRGRDWARWVNAVLTFGALVVSFGVVANSYNHPSAMYIGWAQTVLGLAAIVLLFTPASNAWYTTNRTPAVP